MYFYTFFYLHVFSKNINNVIRITMPNGPKILVQKGKLFGVLILQLATNSSKQLLLGDKFAN